MHPLLIPAQTGGGLSGIAGFAEDILLAVGELGVGLLTLIETVFPPIPSEVILPLGGFLARQGDLNVWFVLAASTVGSYLGALVLYWLGRTLGEERSVRALSKLPLVDRSDFERASGWFTRHGRSAVFFGRLIPGVRSLISLPAGAGRMPLLTFTVLTVAGSGLWNAILITAGYLLGSQYAVVDRYSSVLNWLVVAAVGAVVIWLVVRRVRRRRAERAA